MPDAIYTSFPLTGSNLCPPEELEERERCHEQTSYVPFSMIEVISKILPFPINKSTVKRIFVECKGYVIGAISRLCDEEAFANLQSNSYRRVKLRRKDRLQICQLLPPKST
jgi:hypothetical protein